jgi:hypothetical protein
MSKQKIGLTEKELDLLSWYFWKDEATPAVFMQELGRLGYSEDFAAGILNKIHRAADFNQVKRDQKAFAEWRAINE